MDSDLGTGKKKALSENSVVGPRASVFSPGKDGEAGDVGFIVDTAGCGQADNPVASCSPCCASSVEQLRKQAARSQIEFSDTAKCLSNALQRLMYFSAVTGDDLGDFHDVLRRSTEVDDAGAADPVSFVPLRLLTTQAAF
ncbi:MAG: hypothetical protein IIC50_05035 [Planctomycetes bacterium]|nr:hypothetical protein [Planctomycetota bacterium]